MPPGSRTSAACSPVCIARRTACRLAASAWPFFVGRCELDSPEDETDDWNAYCYLHHRCLPLACRVGLSDLVERVSVEAPAERRRGCTVTCGAAIASPMFTAAHG